MIIVEGADNVGKSTLIKQLLALDPSLRLLHRERFNRAASETIGTSYLKALTPADGDRLAQGNSIADRFFASECIYGDLFRHGCRMGEAEHRAIRSVLASYKAMVIFCDPPDSAITETWKGREQLYNDPLLIAHAYRRRLPKIFAHRYFIRYDWTSPTAENERLRIIRHHRGLVDRERLTWWSAMPFGIGQLESPRIVLVGESLSPKAKTSVPFAAGSAGDFLSWTLGRCELKLGLDLTQWTYVTNAIKGTERDSALLREELRFLNLLDNASIIALGSHAAEMLKYSLPEDRPFHELSHPQYIRRFHYSKRHSYAKKMQFALFSETPTPSLL